MGSGRGAFVPRPRWCWLSNAPPSTRWPAWETVATVAVVHCQPNAISVMRRRAELLVDVRGIDAISDAPEERRRTKIC